MCFELRPMLHSVRHCQSVDSLRVNAWTQLVLHPLHVIKDLAQFVLPDTPHSFDSVPISGEDCKSLGTTRKGRVKNLSDTLISFRIHAAQFYNYNFTRVSLRIISQCKRS